ncbi:hypothetical protein SAMN05216419_104810 [Nitrosomonas cryotolerans]|nr:hypothetical protein SAMN05216419_104810 [Nitrosomonas cryotolerans]
MLKRLGVVILAHLHSGGMHPAVPTSRIGRFEWIVPNTDECCKRNKQFLQGKQQLCCICTTSYHSDLNLTGNSAITHRNIEFLDVFYVYG